MFLPRFDYENEAPEAEVGKIIFSEGTPHYLKLAKPLPDD